MRIARLSILVLATLSVSCARETPSAPAAQAKPAEPQKTAIDAQLKAIDKAKGVEAQLQKEKEQQDRAIDAQEKGDGGG